ncbi:MAG TPA: LysE family translocator [Ignavibacteriaceae bacterium]|nr:LysE family translocator [Ignavibacteriaceae bacterium]
MFDSTTLIAYITACTAIIISPGPAQALVLSITIADGKKAAIITVLGLNSSVIIHTLAAAIGVSAILAASAEAFTIVKFFGAGYLVYLGIQSLLSKSYSHNGDCSKENSNPLKQTSKFFSKAFLTGSLNPKVALFFLAFVPQFVNTAKGFVVLQFLILGIVLAGIDVIYESILVVLIEKLRNKFTENILFIRIREKLSGLVMIGLGIRMAFLKQN